jgi:hypothetical protein
LTESPKRNTSPIQTPKLTAETSVKASQNATGGNSKTVSAPVGSFKNIPVLNENQARTFNEPAKTEASAVEAPKVPTNFPVKTPDTAQGEFRDVASVQTLPLISGDADKPLTRSLNVTTPMVAQKPLVQPATGAPGISVGGPGKTTSVATTKYQAAPIAQNADGKPSTVITGKNALPTNTPSSIVVRATAFERKAAGESRSLTPGPSANYKIATTGQSDGGESLTVSPDENVPPTATTKIAFNAESESLRPATGQSDSVANVDTVKYKIVRVEEEGESIPSPVSHETTATPPANVSDTVITRAAKATIAPAAQEEESEILTDSPNKVAPNDAPQSITPTVEEAVELSARATSAESPIVLQIPPGEFRKSTATPAAILQSASASREGEAKTTGSTLDASAPQMQTPLPEPGDKVPGMDADVSCILPAVAAQAQMAAPKLRKLESPDAAPTATTPSLSESKAESSGPNQKTIDRHPTETTVSARETTKPAESDGHSQERVAEPVSAIPLGVVASAVSGDGTRGALSSQEMKFTTEKNEIAEPATQKVPGASLKDNFDVKGTTGLGIQSDSNRSGRKSDLIGSAPIMDWPSKANDLNVDAAKTVAATAGTDHTATQVEHVRQLLDQQVVVMHQSGANKLAVSLKLDAQTELSLRLTNHNGQIQASIRVDSGSVAGLDTHWKDLQDSLARQNVQLLPLENKGLPRTPIFNSASTTVSASPFSPSSENPQRRSRETRQDLPTAGEVKIFPVTNKATTQTVSRQGWESWA